MSIAKSKVTAQGQISVPAEVRKKLGIGPGSLLEWYDEGGNVVLRRAGSFSSADIHHTLFPKGNRKAGSAQNVKYGIRKHIRQRHAGR
jgi:AbrB family looped-hinge helix DNA binding protein